MSAVVTRREWVTVYAGNLVLLVVNRIVDNAINSRRLHDLTRFKYVSNVYRHKPSSEGEGKRYS
jgi:hypothetical protein